MIITRAPLRISFAGGGSDLPSYYEQSDGAVLSMAINKYVYVTINPKFDDDIRVSYSKTEIVSNAADLEHEIVRACLDYTGISGGLEIVTIADIPSSGTGLGSSSSFTIALLHGLHAYKGEYVSESQLAEEACHIEINVCRAPIGKQDQYISAYGGINYICFRQNGQVEVTPVISRHSVLEGLQDRMLLFYTGKTRSASSILHEQSKRIRSCEGSRKSLARMVELADTMRDALHKGELDDIGPILHENWQLKRELSDHISTADIDAWYEKGMAAGSTGGKLLGAGGGGFLMMYTPPEHRNAVIEALSELKLIPVSLERNGSSVIFYHP